ncbi:regulator of nonsense transcripts 3B isoform X2 [Ischnura elegans]|uniref:regulator of nonsense transcripts 3B isoform X2 n=1 Tax=Ischnura elegans TaxID=197161 RepID=UPI001ED87701|nr:regulator of nonsense transcripts 3B isoform X2 [Ischnura elegans]
MLSDDASDSNQVSTEGKTEPEGKTETDGNKPKEKDKKYRSAPPTKVVIRRLPPTMTLEKFIDQVSPLPENDYLYFAKADASLGQHSFCTAYVNFVQPKDVFIFKEKFDDYIFIDNKGNEFPAVVEFAPFQKIPRKKSRQRDPKCGTIDSDPDYLSFVAQVKQTVEEAPDAGIKSTCGKSSPLLSVQDVLEEIEAKERDRKCRKATTPLIEYIKQRKMERQRMKDEKKEERKRREVERKRAKEEERKHRREANREAIQGKRKEQRRGGDGGASRHEKGDSGHASKPSADNCQSPPPGGGDISKQKKEADFSYDDPEDDDDEEAADEEEDEADQDLYDQEQTQKLKEILRIGTVCKGSEKGSHGELSSEVEVPSTKKGTEKGHVTNVERSRGSGDWERGNRSQRMSGGYNEEYHGARPKVNRADGGGHERRNAKEKKQNDQRPYGESRNREKPGKVWLAKNEARHQKMCDERIRIQKSDGEKGNRDESAADNNVTSVKEDDASEVEGKAKSPVSEDSGQLPPSSQETTPSSEADDLVEVAQSERKSCREGPPEKPSVEAEGRNKSSSSTKGPRDSGTSSNQNTSNGEMRRMRNKDRPSIEIYRPGMRRFNLQKKEAADGGGSTKQSGNAAASNPESPGEVSSSLGSGYSGNPKGKERDDKRRMSGGRGGGNKRRDGSWKQGEDGTNTRHEKPKGREDRGRGNWASQGESMKNCGDGNPRERYDDKPIKDDLVEVRSMTFKRSVSRD